MSPLVTILLYVIIPAVSVALITALSIVRPGRGARYRSGGPWDHEPVWWMGNPRGSGVAAPSEPSTDSTDATLRTARGGARGTW